MSMTLPKLKLGECRSRNIFKLCGAVDAKTMKTCGKEFMGMSMQKYCENHMNPSTRYRPRQRGGAFKEEANAANIWIRHTGFNCSIAVLKCRTCLTEYNVTLVPGNHPYPAQCPDHRTPYRRMLFNRTKEATHGH